VSDGNRKSYFQFPRGLKSAPWRPCATFVAQTYRLFSDAHWRAPVVERLAQLHEARGERARASEYYRSFIELWQDADPELQPRVREARRRLAALTAAEAE
jgi:hypothetical protein